MPTIQNNSSPQQYQLNEQMIKNQLEIVFTYQKEQFKRQGRVFPFCQQLFCRYIHNNNNHKNRNVQVEKIQNQLLNVQDQIENGQHIVGNAKYFYNILKYLYPYFKFTQTKFLYIRRSSNATIKKQIRTCFSFLEQLLDEININACQNTNKLTSSRTKVIKEMLMLSNSAKQFQSLTTKLFSLPILHLNITSSASIPTTNLTQLPILTNKIHKQILQYCFQLIQFNEQVGYCDGRIVFVINKMIMNGLVKDLLEWVVGKAKVRNVLERCFFLIFKRETMVKWIFYYLLTQGNQIHKLQYQTLLITLMSKYDLRSALYQILQSAQSVGKLKQQNHIQFFQLFLQLQSDSFQFYSFYFFSKLCGFWQKNKDFIVTLQLNQLKFNLLAYFIQKQTMEKLQSYQNGKLLIQISQGIEKRLTDTKSYKAALLIWSKFAKLIEFDFQDEKFINISYFKNSVVKQKQNNECEIKQKKIQQAINQNAIKSIQTSPRQQSTPSTQDLLCQPDMQQPYSSPYQINPSIPTSLYDSILALQNPLRRESTLSILPSIIIKNQDQLVFVWRGLIYALFHPLQDSCKQALKVLFHLRMEEFIQEVGLVYFGKDLALNDRIIFITLLNQVVIQLSQNPHKFQTKKKQLGINANQQFFFQKVSSKYYIQKQQTLKKQPQKTRRWGHTKIAHEKSLKSINSLIILDNNPYVNKLYQIANILYFKIISKLAHQTENLAITQPILCQHILSLLGSISCSISNHLSKYTILQQILTICLSIIYRFSTSSQLQSTQQQFIEKSTIPILMGVIQTLNKIVIGVDKNVNKTMIQDFGQAVVRLKRIADKVYGIRPLVAMIQQNFYYKMTQAKY